MAKIQVGVVSYRNPDGTFKPNSVPIYREEAESDSKIADPFARYVAALMRRAREKEEEAT